MNVFKTGAIFVSFLIGLFLGIRITWSYFCEIHNRGMIYGVFGEEGFKKGITVIQHSGKIVYFSDGSIAMASRLDGVSLLILNGLAIFDVALGVLFAYLTYRALRKIKAIGVGSSGRP